MNKKFAGFVGVVSLAMCFFGAVCSAAPIVPVDMYDSQYREEVSMLMQLGITEISPDGEAAIFNGEELVTRSEFLDMTSKITGQNQGNAYDELMTSEEAIKILVDMLGYEPYVKQLGYTKTAASLKLSAKGEYLSRNEAARLIYTALNTQVLELVESGAKIRYSNNNKKTLLEKSMNCTKITGRIMANSVSALKPYNSTGDGRINIGGNVFYCGDVAIDEDLGRTVNAIVGLDDNTLYAYYYYKQDRINEITINASDIIKEESGIGKIRYEGKAKAETVKFDPTAVVIRNGEVLDRYDDNTFRISAGSVTVTSYDLSGKYNLIYISEYETGIVSGVNIYERKIFFKHGRLPLEYGEDSDITVIIDGKTGNIGDIKADYAIDIFASRNGQKTVLSVSKSKVKGKFAVRSEDSIVVGDKEYRLASDNYGLLECVIGEVYTFILNSEGKICSYVGSSDSADGYAYLYAVNGNPKKLHEGIQIKLFTTANEFEKFAVGERIKIDGKNYKQEDFYSASNPLLANDKAKRQLVLFSKNDKGEIENIYTARDNTAGQNKTAKLRLDADEPQKSTRMYRNTFGINYRFLGSTVIFVLPSDEDDANENDYRVASISEWDEDHTFKNYKIYNTDARSRNMGVFVCYEGASVGGEGYNTTKQKSAVIMVDGVSETLNDDGEPCIQIQYYQAGNYQTAEFADKTVCNKYPNNWSEYPDTLTASDVKKGDIMQIVKNGRGKIIEFHMLLRISDRRQDYFERAPLGYALSASSVPLSFIYTAYGEIADIYSGTITVDTNNSPDEDSEEYNRNFKLESVTSYMLYDGRSFRTISSSELSLGDKVFVRAYNYIPYNVLVIRE